MHYRLVCLIISVMSTDRIGLGITHKVFIFTRHMFMHSFFSIFPILNLYCVLFFLLYLSLSRSLSLLNRTYLWHPNRENPLCLGILVKVLGHLLLLFLLFPITSSSVMRRPRWTSLRTSKIVAFIWNAR